VATRPTGSLFSGLLVSFVRTRTTNNNNHHQPTTTTRMREQALPIGQAQSTVYADTSARRLLHAFRKERGLPPKPTAPEMENVFNQDPYWHTKQA
jgi:hypothetical protein